MTEYGGFDLELTDCRYCVEHECVHRNCFRRLPVPMGGLGLCYKLLCGGKYMEKYIVSYTWLNKDKEFKYERSALADTEGQVKKMIRARHRGGLIRIDSIRKMKSGIQEDLWNITFWF